VEARAQSFSDGEATHWDSQWQRQRQRLQRSGLLVPRRDLGV